MRFFFRQHRVVLMPSLIEKIGFTLLRCCLSAAINCWLQPTFYRIAQFRKLHFQQKMIFNPSGNASIVYYLSFMKKYCRFDFDPFH
jgi:hypothetical protein